MVVTNVNKPFPGAIKIDMDTIKTSEFQNLGYTLAFVHVYVVCKRFEHTYRVKKERG